MRHFAVALLASTPANAPEQLNAREVPASEFNRIYVYAQGAMLGWSNDEEVRLVGANFSPFSAGDRRMAKRMSSDLKR